MAKANLKAASLKTVSLKVFSRLYCSCLLYTSLLRFHLIEDESCEKEIKKELEKKPGRMQNTSCFAAKRACFLFISADDSARFAYSLDVYKRQLQDYPRKNCCCIVSGNFEGIPQTGEAEMCIRDSS